MSKSSSKRNNCLAKSEKREVTHSAKIRREEEKRGKALSKEGKARIGSAEGEDFSSLTWEKERPQKKESKKRKKVMGREKERKFSKRTLQQPAPHQVLGFFRTQSP